MVRQRSEASNNEAELLVSKEPLRGFLFLSVKGSPAASFQCRLARKSNRNQQQNMTQPYQRPTHQVRMTTTLPTMFAVYDTNRRDHVAVFDTSPVPEPPYSSPSSNSAVATPTYRITPHRFYQQDALPSFTISDRPANHYMPHISLLTDGLRGRDGQIIYRGECRPSDVSIYSVYHPMPIPVFVFEGSVRWPTIHDNVLQVFPGDRDAYRFWLRRWDPEGVFEAYAAVRDRRVAARPTSPPSTPATPLPKFVADALIAAAVAAVATCPITMEPITHQTAAATSCYHVFDKVAIASWFVNNTTCPTCKQPATV
jgi:hypothetical protein